MAHIRKAYTQRRVVLTPQRRGDQTGNVVCQQHQVPGMQIPANTAAAMPAETRSPLRKNENNAESRNPALFFKFPDSSAAVLRYFYHRIKTNAI